MCSYSRRGKRALSSNNAIRIKAKEPNPYLFRIERRKRAAPTLAHDFGKGSPCSRCDHKCPGLELHYWKDVCLNCGCHLNDHLSALQHTSRSSSADIGRISQRPDKPLSKSSAGTSRADGSRRTQDGTEEGLDEIAVEPGRTRQLAMRFQDLLGSRDQGPRTEDYVLPDLNASSWQTHNSPVKTAAVQKAEQSKLYEQLPRPTTTNLVTVTSSAEESRAASETAVQSDYVDSLGIKDKRLRCTECRRIFAPGQTAIVVNDLHQV
ncbi:unnamed protein product [Notodromas monacha]|uniref:Uncharacterized protein n=1 Tax=Notodromas monacha TaxID=399045 RepID=A0A7R9GKI9_9CRUS|nr:unnamed protein product [Notodromas monacha]CAG0924807.1 unnamed protein product [Notodromas monacha]